MLKPAGVAVHGGAGENKKTLLDILAGTVPGDLTLVHRIDKATAGVILVAKRPEVAAAIAADWPAVEKTYVALAFGALEARTIAVPLDDKHGKVQSAMTVVQPLAILEATTLLEVKIHTGRNHQIRRHLAQVGHPIVMDDKYGDFARNKAFVRAVRAQGAPRPRHLFLASVQIRLTDGRRFDAPLPAAWRAPLAALGVAVDELTFVS